MVAVDDFPEAAAAAAQHPGRSAELGVLDEVVEDLRSGRSGMLTVTGCSGSGRSSLLDTAVATARAAGLRTAAVRSSPLETDLPYSTAAQLLTMLCPPDRLGQVSSVWADDADTDAPIPALCRIFLELAGDRPLLVAVDDDQWTDPWSRRWWQAMARRLDRAPVLLVRAVRASTPEAGARDLFDGAIPVPQRGIHLHPMSTSDVEQVIRASAAEVDHEFAVAAREATHGNASILNAVLDAFAAAGLGCTARTIPRMRVEAADAVADLVTRTLRGLPDAQLELLRAMTFCGGEFDYELACELAGMRGSAAGTARRELAVLGLIDDPGPDSAEPPRPATPAVAAAVFADMDPAERERLHARAAELGHRAAIEPEALAELLLSAPPLSRPWVSDALVDAAEQHRRAGRHERATALLRRALREPAPSVDRQRLLAELAAIEVAHAPAASDSRLRQVLADAAGTGDTGLLVRAADLLVGRGDAETARRELAGVCQRRRHPSLDALAWLAEEECPPDPGLPAPELPGMPDEPQDPAQAGVLAWRLARSGYRPDLVRTLAREALTDRDPDAPLGPRIAACRAMACRDDLAEAAAGLTAVRYDARRRGARAAAAYALVHRAVVATKDGRLAAADADLGAAGEELPLHCWHPALMPYYVAAEITVHLRRERLDEAERAAAVELPLGVERGMAFSYLLHARGELRLAAGDPATALGYFQECGRILRAKRWLNPAVLSWRMPAAVAQGRLGEARAATRLIGEELELAERWGVPSVLEPVHRTALNTLAVAGTGRSGPGAAGISSVRGAALPAALSVPERRAAGLAVRGLSNKDIAEELGVTVRTVELRLTKVYRKLGIEGRAQLPPELDERS